MTTFTAQPVSPAAYTLGEGPVWDPERQRLLWIDIAGGQVHAGRLDPFTVTDSWSFGSTVGAAVVAANGELLVAERETLTRVGTDGSRTELARVLPAGGGSRLNDGAVDPAGRFLVGSMALDGRRNADVLVRLDRDGLTTLDADLTLSNGLAWSLDGGTLLSIDSVPGVVRARDYPDGARRDVFAVTDGVPDGMCLDADGNLWIAVWGRGRVECRTPAGDLLHTVTVAAPHTSSCAFAGPGLDTLVITTATHELGDADRAAFPDSGRVFTARVDTVGVLTPYWNPPSDHPTAAPDRNKSHL
jgi:sugar lactone lactonase YvrE